MSTTSEDYRLLRAQARELLSGETHPIANAANLSAFVYQTIPHLNWVGFYFLENDDLVLGPFQGKPACVRIPPGKGVCGRAVAEASVQRIADVHQFVDHIACDAASNSELVVPIFHDGIVIGVLDLDSPQYDRFSEVDEQGVSGLARVYEASISL